MLVKPRSSKCLTKRSLDITSFSGCVRSSRSAISCSSEPAFTPMRIAQPAAPAASITASTLAQSPMLPGLMRSLAAPALTAPMASLWLKWISATIGTGDSAQMVRKALERGLGGHAHAHDIAASLRQRAHLRKRCLGVSGIGAGHGLDHHRRAATDLHVADIHGACQLARQRMG